MDLQSLKIDRSTKPAARRRTNPWPRRLVVTAVLGLGAWLGWPMLSAFADRVRLPEVRTAIVAEAPTVASAALRGTAANGYIIAARRAALSSDVPGRIVEMAVREGSVVKQGDVVARLYADEYRAALGRADADLATAVANLTRAEAAQRASAADLQQTTATVATLQAQRDEAAAQLVYLQGEHERAADLLRTGIGSPRDVERARSELDAGKARQQALAASLTTADSSITSARERVAVASAEITVAKAQRDAATASRTLAQATLDKTDVRAPFAGIVVLKDAEVGEVVSPNVQGGSNARGAVCTLVDFESLEVQANVPETTLGSVRLGAPADVFLDAFPDQRYAGTVDRIWPTADRQKATVEVRIKLTQRDDRLRPEMGVRIVFRAADQPAPTDAPADGGKPAGNLILVAETAIVTQGAQSGAFVLDRDTVRFVPVTTGERRGGRIVVASGLTVGQTIVVAPPPTLQSGDRVRLAGS